MPVEGASVVSAGQGELLTSEQALTKRWLRAGLRPLECWRWLAGSQTSGFSPRQDIPLALLAAFESFARPLGTHSNAHERQALELNLKAAAEVMLQCQLSSPAPMQPCVERMLASTLLPLYRGLARGTVSEVCSVMRRQLADCATFSLLVTEFAGDLSELLTCALHAEQSPYDCFKKHVQLDLELLSQSLLSTSQRWDGQSTQQLAELVCQGLTIDQRPAWGTSTVLWRLAGELIAERAEFVVPRDWINVPVPWSEASEHWRELWRALQSAQSQPASIPKATILKGTDGLTVSPTRQLAVNAEPGTTLNSGDEDIQRLKLEIEIADAVDSLVQASRYATGRAIGNRTDGSHDAAVPTKVIDDFVVPKLIIAEVRSHNDPAFVSVVRRQLALCRSEEREMSLIAVCVTPDSEEETLPTLQSLGLASWQQKLVNWMSDHPDVHDLYAFVSNEGELILSLMDMERNTTTGLLRQGLVEVLTGVASTSDNSAALSRAPMPAKYYSGIGSVSSPSAGFEPEQLIEATYRCLEAAQRQGKAAIKSIEVF